MVLSRAFALFGEKAGKQLVGLTEFVFLKDDNKLVEILGQLFQFGLLLSWTQDRTSLRVPAYATP